MATLDFSLLGLNQPGVAERFYQGQQEAQRNLLAQQQLMHARQQNELMRQQTAEYERARAAEEGTRNYFAQAQAKGISFTSPEFIQGLYGVSPEKGMAHEKTVVERQKALTEEAKRKADLANTTVEQYGNLFKGVRTPEEGAKLIQTVVNDPALAGTPISKIPLMAAVKAIPSDPVQLENWKNEWVLGAKKYVEQNAPKYFQQELGDVKQLISVPGLGGPAQVVPGSVAAAGMSPYERGRLAQGAAGLNIRAAEADPFGLMGLQQTYGVGVQPPARNALTAPAAAPAVAPTVAPAVAPAIAPAIAPAGTTSISGAPASTAVRAAIQQGLTGPEFIAALPSTVAKEVSAIIDHRMPPPSRFSKRGEQLMQLVSQADPTYDATQYGNKAAAEKQFTSGQLGSSVRSFNVAQDHLSTLAELSAALKNNDYPAINKVSQFVAQQTGSPAPTNFDAAKRIVADEIVKAVIGGRGALGDRKAADETLSKANSPEQLIGVIDTYKKLINGQLNGFEKQYEAATGKKDFRTRFLTAAAGGGPAPAPAQSSVMSQADAILSRGNK